MGLYASHRQVLERAIIDDVQSLLILEDDAHLVDDFAIKVKEFLNRVPSDWDGLMLGGQHMMKPLEIAPSVVKCLNCQRTHAYAIRGKYMQDLYALWHSYFGHCDHVMGPFESGYKVYAPDPFVIGQGSTRSDISGRMDPIRFWSGSDIQAKVALISAPHSVIKDLRPLGFHTGYTRDAKTDVDVGIIDIFMKPGSPTNKVRALRDWVAMVRGEASVFENGVCVIWLPEINDEIRQVCRKAVGPELIELNVNSVADLAQRLPNVPSPPSPRPCGCAGNAA